MESIAVVRMRRTVRRWLRSKKLGVVAINIPDYIAEGEADMREALRIAESVRPCISWVDEVERVG